MKIHVTEYLDVDLNSEKWCCNRCGHEIESARENYKKGCLIAEREMNEVHPPMASGQAFTFQPDTDYCRLIEIYCPSCGVMIENEYLPPGHPLTHEIEIDLDALKKKYLESQKR